MSNTADTLMGSIFSDQAGTLKIEQSGDGTHWDVEDDISVTASTGVKINLALYNPFIRLVWASGTPPTVFRLYARSTSAGVKA